MEGAQMRLRQPVVALLAALALVISLTASVTSAAGPRAAVFLLTLTGNQEVIANPPCSPPTVCGDPDAVAHMVLVVSPATNKVCFAAMWRGIDGTVVAAHIHPAPAGVAGPVAVPLFSGTFKGTDRTARCVSANGLAAAIIANPAAYYVNIHSMVFPTGAVRAQLG
jgi:hypothetical protein